MKTWNITVHMPDGPWVVTVLAASPERAIEAAKRQLRAPARAWAHAAQIEL
jgi:hypothetical protein